MITIPVIVASLPIYLGALREIEFSFQFGHKLHWETWEEGEAIQNLEIARAIYQIMKVANFSERQIEDYLGDGILLI